MCAISAILLSHDKEQGHDACYRLDETPVHYGKKPDRKGYILNDFFLKEILRIDKSIETKPRLVVATHWGEEGMGRNCLMGKRFSFGVMEIFCKYIVVVVVQHWECTKFHPIAHFKMVNFVLCVHLIKSRNSHIYILCGNEEIGKCQIKQLRNSSVCLKGRRRGFGEEVG